MKPEDIAHKMHGLELRNLLKNKAACDPAMHPTINARISKLKALRREHQLNLNQPNKLHPITSDIL